MNVAEQPVDVPTVADKTFFDTLDGSAKFETNLRRGRQMEGFPTAQARSVSAAEGRKPTVDVEELRKLKPVENSEAAEIARRLSIGRLSGYRMLAEARV